MTTNPKIQENTIIMIFGVQIDLLICLGFKIWMLLPLKPLKSLKQIIFATYNVPMNKSHLLFVKLYTYLFYLYHFTTDIDRNKVGWRVFIIILYTCYHCKHMAGDKVDNYKHLRNMTIFFMNGLSMQLNLLYQTF